MFSAEGAAPPNSSPKRGLTCTHSPSPPDPRWSRRFACVSPPPGSVVCSASPLLSGKGGAGGCDRGLRGPTPPSRQLAPHEVGHAGSPRFPSPGTKCGTLQAASPKASSPHPQNGAARQRCRLPAPPRSPGRGTAALGQAGKETRCKEKKIKYKIYKKL